MITKENLLKKIETLQNEVSKFSSDYIFDRRKLEKKNFLDTLEREYLLLEKREGN